MNRYKQGYTDALVILSTKQNVKQKLWEYMTANMDFGNMIILAQSRVAFELGVGRQQVGRSLKQMMKLGLIIYAGKSQMNNIYMLNPENVFKGDLQYLDRAVHKFAVLRGDITGD